MTQEFHRIRRMPPYVFAEVNDAKARARAAGEDIIDLGMGNPDTGTPPHIVAKLVEAVQDPRTHRYSTSKGIPGLRRALAGYYARRFGVKLDPETEVVATLGSKEGLANLAAAITSPGDTILVPNPSYPIHQFGFIIAGASVRSIPADAGRHDAAGARQRGAAQRAEADGADRQLPQQPDRLSGRSRLLPGDRRVLPPARHLHPVRPRLRRNLLRRRRRRPRCCRCRARKDIAVEFTSLSKTYSMPGWRMGFAAGNARLIGALARMKSYLDYGAFTPIQVAATAALNGPQDCVAEMRALYRERRDVLVRGLAGAGWDVPSPDGSMFAWAPIPPRYAHLGSVEFSKLLLARAKVAVAPGIGFGEHGDGHVRIALVENTHRLRQAMRNIRGFLQADSNVAPHPAEAVAQ